MKNELQTLKEGIEHLIVISDVLESVRRKFNSSELYNGQQSLSTAIAQFKDAKGKLIAMQKQIEKNRNDEKEGN
jgi:hypothetical protein